MENHAFFEHADIRGAHQEAHRLARKVGGIFVVYSPIIIVANPLPQIREFHLVDMERLANARLPTLDDDDLPF